MESSKTRERKPESPVKESVSHSLTTVLCDEDENILTIPALGRIAHLVYLYKSKSDSFRPVSVFKQTVPDRPDTFVTTAKTPNKVAQTSIINTISDKLRLLNVDPTPVHVLPLNLDCGGRIPMYAKGESILITYKEYQRYSNNERCLWTFDNEANHSRSKQTITMKLLRHGFAEPVDWLYALKFNRNTGLVSQRIESGKEYLYSEDQLYLSFTSDGSVAGFGFELQLTVIDSVETGHGWVKYSSSSSGVAEGAAYVDNDLFNIVINPKRSIDFYVNFVHIEKHRRCDYDRLLVWEIAQIGNTFQQARLCGDISTAIFSFSTPNPVIVLFTADGSNTGPSNAGFKVSWS